MTNHGMSFFFFFLEVENIFFYFQRGKGKENFKQLHVFTKNPHAVFLHNRHLRHA